MSFGTHPPLQAIIACSVLDSAWCFKGCVDVLDLSQPPRKSSLGARLPPHGLSSAALISWTTLGAQEMIEWRLLSSACCFTGCADIRAHSNPIEVRGDVLVSSTTRTPQRIITLGMLACAWWLERWWLERCIDILDHSKPQGDHQSGARWLAHGASSVTLTF